MKNPFVLLLRAIALKRNESRSPHCLHPLREIKAATVLLDTAAEDTAAVKSAVKQYFDYHGITVRIFCPGSRDLDLMGTLKRKVRGPRLDENAGEMFISLVDPLADFCSEYEARCSRACFKVGRRQLPGDVFDLVILSPEGTEPPSQSAVFSEIKNYLNIIR